MTNLYRSQWAPTVSVALSTPGITPQASEPSVAAIPGDAERSDRLLRRLEWKASLLVVSYRRAIDSAAAGLDAHGAKAMFKVDFFEFYVLLERLLVHLLGMLRIPVERSVSQSAGQTGRKASFSPPDAASNRMIIGSSKGPFLYHRFHAEVLQALDQRSNPLHPVLGRAPVREYLGVAKEFRNRWKDALSSPHDAGLYSPERQRTIEGMQSGDEVDDVNLEDMLGSIFDALHKAQEIAKTASAGKGHDTSDLASSSGRLPKGYPAGTGRRGDDVMDYDADGPWEAVPDAMEWE